MAKIKLGIIGGGIDSAVGKAHVSAIRLSNEFDITACKFSKDLGLDKKSHNSYQIPWRSKPKDLQAFINEFKSELDMVLLLTPSTQHFGESSILIKSGMPFVTEKPVACSLDEVKKITKIINKYPNIYSRFIHNYSGFPLYRELVRRAKKGFIGNIRDVRVQMPSDGYARISVLGPPQNWRHTKTPIPMLSLDLGTHLCHLVSLLIGKSPGILNSRQRVLNNKLDLIDDIQIWNEREDGISVSYWMSKGHLGIKNGLSIEVYGDNGSLKWELLDPDHLVQSDINSNQLKINRGSILRKLNQLDRFKPGHPTGFIEAFANFYQDLSDDFHRFRKGQTPNIWISPITEALEGLEFLHAATKSHQSRKWVKYE